MNSFVAGCTIEKNRDRGARSHVGEEVIEIDMRKNIIMVAFYKESSKDGTKRLIFQCHLLTH